MDAAEWLAQFDRIGEEYRAGRQAHWDRCAARGRPVVVARAAPVVLEVGRDWADDEPVTPKAAAGMASLAKACGWWPVRVVVSVAADPGKGLLRVVTVRARRHDERVWAGWVNDAFDAGQYLISGASIEQLGGVRMSSASLASTSVDAMTVPQIKNLAAERGIKIPSKFKKAEVIEHVKAAGLTAAVPPAPRRGVLDVIEGIRGPRQWIEHFEAQEVARAVGLISAAFVVR